MFDSEFINILAKLISATIICYVIGSIPVCHLISRKRGINIVEVGSKLAGSSNVTKNLGKLLGSAAFFGDFFKGILAINICILIGIEGNLMLLPLMGAIIGHCKPVFAKFKGGDGMAVLGGSALAIFGIYAVLAIIGAVLIAFGTKKIKHVSSLTGFATGYLILSGTSIAVSGISIFIFGFGGVYALVLAHAINGHRVRNSTPISEWANANTHLLTPAISTTSNPNWISMDSVSFSESFNHYHLFYKYTNNDK